MKEEEKSAIKMQNEIFILPEGVTGQLQWPNSMSLEAYEDFVYQVEGLKKHISRSVRKSSERES